MSLILAIDPGSVESGWCIIDGLEPVAFGKTQNGDLLTMLAGYGDYARLLRDCDMHVIEMVASYGMPVGADVFETCVWIGRFWEAWRAVSFGDDPMLVYRKDVKLALCGTPRANDANVRCEIQHRLGKVGTKKEPGPLFGVKSHVWPALGVAIVANQKLGEQCKS